MQIPSYDPAFKTGFLAPNSPLHAWTPVGIVMWPYLLSPRKPDPKNYLKVDSHQGTLVFPADADLTILRKLATDAATKAFGTADPAQWPKGWNENPLFKEHTTQNQPPFLKTPGAKFISCTKAVNPQYPLIVRDVANQPIKDEVQIYSGCKGRFLVHAYVYGVGPKAPKGSKIGIKFDIDGFQKIEDGEPIRTGPNLEAGFVAAQGPAAAIDAPTSADGKPAASASDLF